MSAGRNLLAGVLAVVIFGCGMGTGVVISSALGNSSSTAKYQANTNTFEFNTDSFDSFSDDFSDFSFNEDGFGEGNFGGMNRGGFDAATIYNSLSDSDKKTVQSILGMSESEILSADMSTILSKLESLSASDYQTLAGILFSSAGEGMMGGKRGGRGQDFGGDFGGDFGSDFGSGNFSSDDFGSSDRFGSDDFSSDFSGRSNGRGRGEDTTSGATSNNDSSSSFGTFTSGERTNA